MSEQTSETKNASKAEHITGSAASEQSTNIDVEARVRLGVSLFEQKRYDEARTEFDAALAANEQFPDIHYLLGLLAAVQGHHPEAENHFRKAAELNPHELDHHYNLGLALHNQKRWSDAETEYRAALALKPDYYLARTGLGECLFEQKRYDEARTEFEAARALNEQDPEIHNWLGRFALLQKHDSEAEVCFRKATELNPDESVYHNNLGLALRNQKRWSDAESEYRAALALKPDDYLARIGLGGCLFEQKRYDEARTEFDAALAADEQDPEIHSWLGRVAEVQGHHAEAENHFRKATELNPDEPGEHYNLGLWLRNQKRWSDAESEYRAALALKPDDYLARTGLGGCLFDQKRYDEARTEFDAALAANEQDPEIHSWLGRVAEVQGHHAEAENHFRKATELNPDEPGEHYNLGLWLSNQKRWSDAESEYRAALALKPDDYLARTGLGECLFEQKRYDEAMQEDEECLLLAKQSTDASFLRSSYHNIAWVLGKQGRFGKSLENWRKAIQEYEAGAPEAARTSDSSYFGRLGTIVYSALGDLPKAAGWLEQGRKLDPDNVDILSSLVELYLEKCNDSVTGFTAQQRDERSRAYWSALDAYNRARKVLKKKLDEETPGTQKHAETVVRLATLLEGMHEYEEARGLLADLLKRERDPPISSSSFTDALSTMGVVLMRLERFEEAAQHFERALRDDPDDLVQRINLAEAYLKSKRPDKAETEYRKLLAITEDSVEALIGLGEVYTAMADNGDPDLYDVAVDYFSRGRRTAQSESRSKWLRRKEEAAVLYSRGYARVRWVETAKPRTGNQTLKEALDDFKQCCALDPEHYKAERAKKKVADWLDHSVPERVEKYGSSIIFCLSFLVFFGSQLGFYFAQPPAGKTNVGYWVLATFGSLLFMIAGLYLPQLLKIKVVGIELEKSSVDQVAAPVALGIARP